MSKALTILDMYLKVLEEDLCSKCQEQPSVKKLREKLNKDQKDWFTETFLTD